MFKTLPILMPAGIVFSAMRDKQILRIVSAAHRLQAIGVRQANYSSQRELGERNVQ
jgi:hypothetical protein